MVYISFGSVKKKRNPKSKNILSRYKNDTGLFFVLHKTWLVLNMVKGPKTIHIQISQPCLILVCNKKDQLLYIDLVSLFFKDSLPIRFH